MRNSLLTLLDERRDEISPRMRHIILDLRDDWMRLNQRIDAVTEEIAEIGQVEKDCRNLRTIPVVGPIISTGVVTLFHRGRLSAFSCLKALRRSRPFTAR